MEQRVIKFRVWVGNKMEYSVVVGGIGNFFAYIDPHDSASAITTKYQNDIPIMQFTGLHDKNGKEIYEGDVLLLKDKTKWLIEPIGTQNQDETFYGIVCTPESGDKYAVDKSILRGEIIGNIHENPEFLK